MVVSISSLDGEEQLYNSNIPHIPIAAKSESILYQTSCLPVMSQVYVTPLLDLAQTISTATLLITKYQLQEQQSAAIPNQSAGLDGTAAKKHKGVARQDYFSPVPSTEQIWGRKQSGTSCLRSHDYDHWACKLP